MGGVYTYLSVQLKLDKAEHKKPYQVQQNLTSKYASYFEYPSRYKLDLDSVKSKAGLLNK